MKKIIPIIILITAFPTLLKAQPLNSIYENNSLVSFEKYVYNPDSLFFTSIRPWLLSDFKKTFDYESAVNSYKISKFIRVASTSPHPPSKGEKESRKPQASDLLFNTHLITVNGK